MSCGEYIIAAQGSAAGVFRFIGDNPFHIFSKSLTIMTDAELKIICGHWNPCTSGLLL